MQRDTSGCTRHHKRNLTLAEISPQLTLDYNRMRKTTRTTRGGDEPHHGSKGIKPQPKTFENLLGTSRNATRQLRIDSASREESNSIRDITRDRFRLKLVLVETGTNRARGPTLRGPTALGIRGDETTTENMLELIGNRGRNKTPQDTLGITRGI